MNRFSQALVATVPLLLTPVVVYGLSQDWLDLGGGEKDVLLALPWLIWSLLFALCSYVLIHRRWAVGRWALRSTLVSIGSLVALWLVALAANLLGLV